MLNLAWDACCLFPTLKIEKKQFVKKNSSNLQYSCSQIRLCPVFFPQYFDLAKQADFYWKITVFHFLFKSHLVKYNNTLLPQKIVHVFP
jgi:hypothetical protein